MGLLPCVNIRVFFHVGLLVKSLTTELALERARVRMNQHVRGKRGGTLEALAARLALEWLPTGVHDHVLFQADRIVKRFIADLTVIKLFCRSCPSLAIIFYDLLILDAVTHVINLLAIFLMNLCFVLGLSLIYGSSL